MRCSVTSFSVGVEFVSIRDIAVWRAEHPRAKSVSCSPTTSRESCRFGRKGMEPGMRSECLPVPGLRVKRIVLSTCGQMDSNSLHTCWPSYCRE